MGENPGLLFEKWKQSIQSNGKFLWKTKKENKKDKKKKAISLFFLNYVFDD